MFLLAWLFRSDIQNGSFPGVPAVRMSLSLIRSQTTCIHTSRYLYVVLVYLFGFFNVVLGFFFHPSSTLGLFQYLEAPADDKAQPKSKLQQPQEKNSNLA